MSITAIKTSAFLATVALALLLALLIPSSDDNNGQSTNAVATPIIHTIGGSCNEWTGSKSFPFTLKPGKKTRVLIEHCYGENAPEDEGGAVIDFAFGNSAGACYMIQLQGQSKAYEMCRGEKRTFDDVGSKNPNFVNVWISREQEERSGPVHMTAKLTS